MPIPRTLRRFLSSSSSRPGNARAALTRLAWTFAVCASLQAQTGKTISVHLRDGRTGLPVTAANFLLRVDHHETIHNDWVQISDDGAVTITVPDDAKEISLQATYGDGMETYINCDAAKQSDKEREIWYPIDLILKNGVVAPNECSKTEYPAKPGEFVFFVRRRGALDRLHNPDAQ
jgi:hypothetical protein